MLQNARSRLILASASASRRSLLQAAGLRFEVHAADVDEATIRQSARAAGLSAEMTALRLADLKAAAIAGHAAKALVIGADQILVCNGKWYDKPADMTAARQQLRALRGQSHVLATAVAGHCGKERVWSDIATPRLVMRNFSEDFLDQYLAQEGDTVTGTVGAYRLEARGIQLFEAVEGEHSAILGLPMLPLLGFLRRAGILIV